MEIESRDPRVRGLRPDEVARVLQRAAELDAAAGVASSHGDLVDPGLVEDAAVEAGLSRAAVRQAIDELALEPAVLEGRLLGPGRIVLERRLPGTLEEVTARVHAFLRSQLLTPQRVTPTRSRWVPRRGLSATLRRATDLNGRIRLQDVDAVEVVTRAVLGVEGLVQVQLELDVSGVRRRQAVALAGGAGAGAVGAGAVLLLVGVAPAAVIALPVGVGLAAGGHLAGRSRYRQRTGRVHDAVAGELDLLEHPMALPPAPPRVRPTPRHR